MANIDGFDLRERPWQPGLDDARFNQQPRNPNFTGGASPEATAYQRANDLRGMSATERPWTGADTKAFGNRPAGVPPSVGEPAPAAPSATQPASRLARTSEGAGRLAGRASRIGLQALATAPLVGFGDYKLNDPGTDSSLGGTLRALGGGDFAGAGRSLQKGAVEAGLDAASGVAKTVDAVTGLTPWGTDLRGALDRRVRADLGDQLLPADDASAQPAPAVQGPATTTPPGGGHGAADPYAAATAAEKAAAPQAAAPQAPATQVVAQAPDGTVLPAAQAYGGQAGAPTNNLIVRDGNSYSGGIVGPNARIGDRQADGDVRLRDFGGGFVQGGSFAPVAAAAPVQAPVAEAPQVRHSGNDWAARNRLRNLEVSASSITNNGGRFDQHRGASPAARAYLEAARQDLALQGAQPGLDLETTKSNNALRGQEMGANASRYTADQNLRGEIFKATASVGNAHAQAQRDAEKYATDRRREATERLDKVLGSYATVDGKVDEGRLAALRNNAQAFIGTAIDAARKRGDEATARQLEREGLTALADDPSLMRKYAAAMKLDAAARRRNGGNYVGTDNPGARVVNGVTPRNMVGLGGEVVMSDGTRVPRNRVEYDPNSGILPNGLAHIDPWSNRTTEYDSIDPRGLLRKEAQ